MSVKIYIMTHKKFPVPDNPVFYPLHVGREGKEDLGYPGDHTGENISSKNCYYSELTGLYWVAHNDTDGDYLGLCHYRRYFLDDKGGFLTGYLCESILKEYDMILPRAVIQPKSYCEVYRDAHNIDDLTITGEVLKQLYPEDYPAFKEAMEGRRVYNGNMFVTSRELFMEYTQWLFSIFDIVEQKINPDAYDSYHRRVYGFLSEQLLYVWVKSRGLKIYEAAVGLTQEKAETIELKEKIKQQVAIGTLASVREALAVFRATMSDRPDLILAASDLSGELADMFRILYVCEQELMEGHSGMLAISRDMNVLLKHYRLLCNIVKKLNDGTASAQEASYYKDSRVSGCLLRIILNNQ